MRTRPAALLAVAATAAAALVGGGIAIARSGDQPFHNSPEASETLERIDPAAAGPVVTAASDAGTPLQPPAATPEEAVKGFLDALVAGDADKSFSLLDAADRAALGPLPAWRVQVTSLPRYVSYHVTAVDTANVRTDVTIEPRLDEVVGYVPAQAGVTWPVVAEDGGYRVSMSDSTIEPVLPSDDAATAAAGTWVSARQQCQDGGTYSGNLLGQPTLADQLCRAEGTFQAGGAGGLERFRDPSLLLNAFGADAATFVRVVPIDGPKPFQVALAPLGDTWEVVGVMQT